MSKDEAIIILQKFINKLTESQISIEKAYLYGSYAKNSANNESDIDVMLISALFDKNYYDQIGKIWVISKEFHEKIEPYMVGKNKFIHDDISPLLEIVRKEGIEIPLKNH